MSTSQDILTNSSKHLNHGARLQRIGLALQVAGVEWEEEEIDSHQSLIAVATIEKELAKLIREMKREAA